MCTSRLLVCGSVIHALYRLSKANFTLNNFFFLASLKSYGEHCISSLDPNCMRAVWRELKLSLSPTHTDKVGRHRWFCKQLIVMKTDFWEVTSLGPLALPHNPMMHSRFQVCGS